MRSAWLELVVLVIASAGCSIPPRDEPKPEGHAGRAPVAASVPTPTPVVEVVDPSSCVLGSAQLQQICIPALPDDVARCEDCDLACINRVFERLRDGPKVAGLACDEPPVPSGEGCCFSAKVTGHWTACGGM